MGTRFVKSPRICNTTKIHIAGEEWEVDELDTVVIFPTRVQKYQAAKTHLRHAKRAIIRT